MLRSKTKDSEITIHSFVPQRDEFGNVARRVVYLPLAECKIELCDMDGNAVEAGSGVAVLGFRVRHPKIDELHVHSVELRLAYDEAPPSMRTGHVVRVELYCFEEESHGG